MDVIGLSPDECVCRRMSMYYGVLPLRMVRREPIDSMLHDLDAKLLEQGLVECGDLIVVVAGTRLEHEGATNALFIHLVGGKTHTCQQAVVT